MSTLKVFILKKLYRHSYIGRRHLSVTSLKQGLPSHERDMSIIIDVVKELIKEGFLIYHKKGSRVSLSPRLLKKIKEMIS